QPSTYFVVVTDLNGCSASDSIRVDLTGPGVPEVSVSGVCNGEAIATVVNADPAFEYTWNTGESSRQVFINGSGTYTVTASDTTGCFVSTNVQVGTIANCQGVLLLKSPFTALLFDTIDVDVTIRNADRIFSAYATVEFDSSLLAFAGNTPGDFFGSSTNASAATLNGDRVDFGIYQSSGLASVSGDGSVYRLRFVVKDMNTGLPFDPVNPGYFSTLFRLTNIFVTDSIGSQPASYAQNSVDSSTTFFYYLVPVW
ncbi:MAG: cohesin domain-containing protein, partial [Flavobacteriales bacterium]